MQSEQVKCVNFIILENGFVHDETVGEDNIFFVSVIRSQKQGFEYF
jgi:hypothetical protein